MLSPWCYLTLAWEWRERHKGLKRLIFWVIPAMAFASACGDDDRLVLDAGTDPSDAEVMSDAMMTMDGTIDVDAAPDLDADTPDTGPPPDAGEGDAGTDAGPMPDSCFDGVRNGDETDTDCGGPTCAARCEDFARCTLRGDCQSDVCIGGTCIAPSCNDGVRNGDETGNDCGGPTCQGCSLGQACLAEADCAEGTCNGGFCVADHCFNGVRDVNETDVDCGGADCAPCLPGSRCRGDRDCDMATCLDGFCLTPACSNGILDVGEVDVDCGGECPGCADGTACMLGADCLSDRCEGSICTSCADGVQNGAETGVDCGGSVCRGCAAGGACSTDDDCASRVCDEGVCTGAGIYYEERFDAPAWTSGGTNSSWEFETPANTRINRAFTGSAVWVTNATGNYNANEDSWVESPEFSLASATDDPIVQLARTFISEIFSGTPYDPTTLEVSYDGGDWTRVGSATSGGENWYVSMASFQGPGWGGAYSDWAVAQHTLVGGAGRASVRLRLRFRSDGSGQAEGLAFDDVIVRDDFCDNGILDGPEADVDCGGLYCEPCAAGSVCTTGGDCVSGACDFGVCVSCDDGIQNGAETDIDCGGDVCAPCSDTSSCDADLDCISGRCEAGTCTSCFDGIQNGGETFIDCGGGGCGLCLGGATCTDDSQCLSGDCDAGVCAVPASTGLRWTFDAGDEGWTSGGTDSSWEYATPVGPVITSAYTGTSVWVTNATGSYNNDEASWVQSPSFDLSSYSTDPSVRLALTYRTEQFSATSTIWDYAWLESSIDGGTTWTRVGAAGTGANWYNRTTTPQGWGGLARDWFEASNVLVGTAGRADVRIRVRFFSDGSGVDDGVAFDDVEIVPSLPDLTPTITPSATLCDGVVVTVTNVGTAAVSFFDLLTNVDGTMSTTRITQLIEPGGSYAVELRASANIEASVRAVGDADPSNDTAMFSTVPRTIGMRYVDTFEMGTGDFVTTGTNSSWRHGTPSASFIQNAASGTQAWVTNPSGSYNASEASYLVSPCFDFSGFGTDPRLSFAYTVDTERPNDFAFVEISTNGGATWSKLGTFGTGANWYNDLLADAWSGRESAAGVWVRASHPLAGAAGAGAVRLRVAFVSNETVQREGFGFDDFILMP